VTESPLEWIYLVKRVVSSMLLPPFGFFLLSLVLMIVALSKPAKRITLGMAILSLVFGLFVSTHWASGRLVSIVESFGGESLSAESTRAILAGTKPPQAVVILAGGLAYDEREPGGPATPSTYSLQRTLYGSRLAKQTGLRVLLSGGPPPHHSVSEAQAMAQVMSSDLGVKAAWLDIVSLNTRENAEQSAKLLMPEGIKHVFLVTHAAHMLRSRIEFERVGFQVTVAPMGFQAGQGAPAAMVWLPTPSGAVKASYAVHEVAGLLWYRLTQPLALPWAPKLSL
jgi:uncharacterized SAM-binding protein YcdF (DUF218 family)